MQGSDRVSICRATGTNPVPALHRFNPIAVKPDVNSGRRRAKPTEMAQIATERVENAAEPACGGMARWLSPMHRAYGKIAPSAQAPDKTPE
jgi:hypothetical protein